LLTQQGICIWSVLDPANPFVSPTSAPWTIGLAYACMIWGFANATSKCPLPSLTKFTSTDTAFSVSTNLARDLGTRIVAAIFFGKDAFNRYAPIVSRLPDSLHSPELY
jgi:glycerol uptake facilitator-like aquaporin